MIRAVLFDLDGTLLDSAPDLVGTLNDMRDAEGLEALDWREMQHNVSQGAMGLIRRGLPPADAGIQQDRCNLFIERYAQRSFRDSSLFDGVRKLLDELAGRGIPWGIVTNKIERLTLPILRQAGLLPGAGCVICGDTSTEKKPHPGPVLLACELLGVQPPEAIFVGDDERDVQSGRAAGTSTAVAGYGYIPPGLDRSDWGSTNWLDRPEDVLGLLQGDVRATVLTHQ